MSAHAPKVVVAMRNSASREQRVVEPAPNGRLPQTYRDLNTLLGWAKYRVVDGASLTG